MWQQIIVSCMLGSDVGFHLNNVSPYRYEKSSRFMKVGYERDFLRYLQSLLAEVERRIRRGHARLALSQNQQSSGVSLEESLRQIILPQR